MKLRVSSSKCLLSRKTVFGYTYTATMYVNILSS